MKTLLRIRTLSLDLDDTLWPIEPVIRRAEKMLWAHFAQHHPRIADEWTTEMVLQLRADIINEFPGRTHDLRFLRKTVLSRIAAQSGYGAEIVEPAFAVFDKARNEVELYPGVEEELAQLSSQFGLIAITNGNANLHRIGIAHYFDAIVTSEAVGAAKPSRIIFDEAIRIAGVAADEIMHIGDHPETDVHGAKQAGMRAAWVNHGAVEWPGGFDAPDIIVRGIADVRPLLLAARKAEQQPS